MSAHKASNLSGGPLVMINSIGSELPRAKRRTAWEHFFDEESDSDDEEKMFQTAHPIADSLVKLPISETFMCNNKDCYVLTNLQNDQLWKVCCGHCECCKKMKDFLERLPTNKSAASYDNTLGCSTRHRAKKFKKTPSSWKVDIEDKCSDSGLGYVENSTVNTANRNAVRIAEYEDSLFDFSIDDCTSEQNCTVRNTELNEANDEHSNATNILFNVQNDVVSSQQCENEGKTDQNFNQTRRKTFVRRNGTNPNQNINNTVHSSKDHSNDGAETAGNNSDLSTDDCTSEQNYCTIRNTELYEANDEHSNTTNNMVFNVQSDALASQQFENEGKGAEKKNFNQPRRNAFVRRNRTKPYCSNSDLSTDDCTSEQNFVVSNTDLNEGNGKNSNTTNILPNVQNDALPSQQFENGEKEAERKSVNQTRNSIVHRSVTEPIQNIKSALHSSKYQINDVPEKNTNSSNSDLLTDDCTSEQNCTVRNTELNEANDENSNNTNILSNVQNDALSSQQNAEKENFNQTRRNAFIRRNGINPNQSINSTVHSSKDHSNDGAEKIENNTNSSDSDLSTDYCTSEQNFIVRNTELNEPNGENSNTTNILPNVQNDALSSQQFENEGKGAEKKIFNQTRNSVVRRSGTEPIQNIKSALHSSKYQPNDVPEKNTNSSNPDLSTDDCTSEQDFVVRNTELNEENGKNSNTTNILPNVQNNALPSQQFENEEREAEKKSVTQTRNSIVRRSVTAPIQSIKSALRSSKYQPNDVPEKYTNNSDLSTDDCTSEQDFVVRNTELNEGNGKNLNTTNILPNVQNDAFPSQQFENEEKEAENKSVNQTRNSVVRRSVTAPIQYIKSALRSSKYQPNDVPEKNTNSSNSDLSTDDCTSEQNFIVRNTELSEANEETSNTTNILPNVQNDALSSQKFENEGEDAEKKNVNQTRNSVVRRSGTEPIQNIKSALRSSKSKYQPNDVPEKNTNSTHSDLSGDENTPENDCTRVKRHKGRRPKKVRTVNNVKPPKASKVSPEKTSDSNDSPEKTESKIGHSYAKRKLIASPVKNQSKDRAPPPNKQRKGPPMQPKHNLPDTDPYNLGHAKRATRSNNPLVTPVTVSVDSTANRNFSNAVVRKLGRTGGISFDMEARNAVNGSCKSIHTKKSRTLYSSDEWLSSEEFLKLTGDKY